LFLAAASTSAARTDATRPQRRAETSVVIRCTPGAAASCVAWRSRPPRRPPPSVSADSPPALGMAPQTGRHGTCQTFVSPYL